jgi:hypothetical protein
MLSTSTSAMTFLGVLDLLAHFSLSREYLGQIHSGKIGIREISIGHIHTTYHVFDSSASSPFSADGISSYILQQMNHRVFPHPPDLISNLLKISQHLRQKSITTIQLIPLQDTVFFSSPSPPDPQTFYYQDHHGNYWRMFSYIPNSTVLTHSPSLHEISLVANAYGNFQSSLSDLCPSSLVTTIPNFHNTKIYHQKFLDAVATDPCQRIEKYSLHSEIQSLCSSLRSQRLLDVIPSLHERSGVPYRIVHYDTKVENILFDLCTRQPICVIDLDTVMSGSLLFDFGDMVRSLCTTAGSEDETDLEKISLDLMKFRAIVEGYLRSEISSTQSTMSRNDRTKPITEIEIDHLVIAAQVSRFYPSDLFTSTSLSLQVVAYEQGIRFLTDFILGDVYYKISPQQLEQGECLQNLDRARNQFQLLLSMESREEEMRDIVDRVWEQQQQAAA